MFELAVKTYGAVDSVIANAGVSEMREPCGFFEGKEGADGKPMVSCSPYLVESTSS